MMTYEMVGVSDQNGRTYKSKYGTYNKKDGFKINPSYITFQRTEDSNTILFDYQKLINDLFHENCWSLKQEKPKPKKMTKEEIEKALGYEIEIDDEDELVKSKDIKINSSNTENTKNKSVFDNYCEPYRLDELIKMLFDQIN